MNGGAALHAKDPELKKKKKSISEAETGKPCEFGGGVQFCMTAALGLETWAVVTHLWPTKQKLLASRNWQLAVDLKRQIQTTVSWVGSKS